MNIGTTSQPTSYLYHIADSMDMWKLTENEGLRPHIDGYIYLLADQSIAEVVAYNQLFLQRFVLIKIEPAGITRKLKPDLVTACTAQYQVRVKQKLIESKFLSLVGSFEVNRQNVVAYMKQFFSLDPVTKNNTYK